ncbi:hypothetical protein APZ15_10325 [Burkholderia cepacia ATCC 25416]|nr:hypothetical protein APZ15_10325 [Burkholderia cepacia ATCC 25416]
MIQFNEIARWLVDELIKAEGIHRLSSVGRQARRLQNRNAKMDSLKEGGFSGIVPSDQYSHGRSEKLYFLQALKSKNFYGL